ERGERLGEVRTDRGTELRPERLGVGAVDLHPVSHPGALVPNPLYAMRRADDDVIEVGLVNEQHRLDYLSDPQLDRLLPRRGHHDAAPGCERSAELDSLDATVPLRPAVDVCPKPPHLLGTSARLDAVFADPHSSSFCGQGTYTDDQSLPGNGEGSSCSC